MGGTLLSLFSDATGADRAYQSTMKHYIWDSYFVELFDACVDEYDDGNKDYESWFSDEDQEFLKGIGCREREFFDYVRLWRRPGFPLKNRHPPRRLSACGLGGW